MVVLSIHVIVVHVIVVDEKMFGEDVIVVTGATLFLKVMSLHFEFQAKQEP